MTVDGALQVLSEDESLRLLATSEVGRIGLSTAALPAIFPVNYRMVDGAIVFRTAPGSKLAAATEGVVVAFEVDDYGLFDHSGWSVLAVGKAEVVDDPVLAQQVMDTGLEPFADGDRTSVVRIVPTVISGRRITHQPARD